MSDQNTTDNVHATVEPVDTTTTDDAQAADESVAAKNVHATIGPVGLTADTDEATPASVHAADERA
jgi:hypothetical protein